MRMIVSGKASFRDVALDTTAPKKPRHSLLGAHARQELLFHRHGSSLIRLGDRRKHYDLQRDGCCYVSRAAGAKPQRASDPELASQAGPFCDSPPERS